LRDLKRPADPERTALRRRQRGDIAPDIEDASGIRRDGAADDAEQRGLAGAFGPIMPNASIMLAAPKGIWGLIVVRFGWQLFPLERTVLSEKAQQR